MLYDRSWFDNRIELSSSFVIRLDYYAILFANVATQGLMSVPHFSPFIEEGRSLLQCSKMEKSSWFLDQACVLWCWLETLASLSRTRRKGQMTSSSSVKQIFCQTRYQDVITHNIRVRDKLQKERRWHLHSIWRLKFLQSSFLHIISSVIIISDVNHHDISGVM
jgi:hypothetical protein